MPSVTIEEAKEKVKTIMPYLRHAANRAQKAGEVQLGILAVRKDGTGKVIARLEAAEFFEDLALVLGMGPLTPEENLDADIIQFLDEHGLRKA